MHIIHGFKTDCTTAIPKDPPINDLTLLIITSWIDYEPIFSTRLWNFKFNNKKTKNKKKKKKEKYTSSFRSFPTATKKETHTYLLPP